MKQQRADDSELPLAKVGHRQATHADPQHHSVLGVLAFTPAEIKAMPLTTAVERAEAILRIAGERIQLALDSRE